MQRGPPMLVIALLVTGVLTGIATANPPRPGTEGNGLSENESATLWSHDEDAYISDEEYRQQYGDSRTRVHSVANGTDITFKRPPDTAATWTRNDFGDLQAGDANTSVHPSHATLEDGVFIEDAHATMFAAHPSTRGHLESGDTPLYVAPTGTLRGFVDYRIRGANETASNETALDRSVTTHEIDEIRLKQDDTVIARMDGTHTPEIEYRLEDDRKATLTLKADIEVQLADPAGRGDRNRTDDTAETETLTVSDSIDVEVYDLEAHPYYAEYPDGDSGVAIFQTRPWQGYTLTDDTSQRVRGVWRFYTARNTNWDTLVQSNRTGRTAVESDAIPVFVHAYPSRIGPRAEPVRDGPEIIDVWGLSRPSPAGTIGENVETEVVNQSYSTSFGVAVRADGVDRDELQVAGIVRGEHATIVEPDEGSDRELRRSTLSVEILQQDADQATLRIELRDAETGDPIVLEESPRRAPVDRDSRSGSITVAGTDVETNSSGVAIVTVDQSGIYTARYHPGSWLGHEPAYVGDTATVRWHPLGTIDGWFAFVFEVSWQLIPFFVLFYAGHRILRMLGPNDRFERHP